MRRPSRFQVQLDHAQFHGQSRPSTPPQQSTANIGTPAAPSVTPKLEPLGRRLPGPPLFLEGVEVLLPQNAHLPGWGGGESEEDWAAELGACSQAM